MEDNGKWKTISSEFIELHVVNLAIHFVDTEVRMYTELWVMHTTLFQGL